MKNFLRVALWLVLPVLAGCVTGSRDAAGHPGLTETCQVCRYNRDLACVCVEVKDTTPRVDYQGTTYYFCSEDCRAAFVKNSNRYLPRAKAKP